MTDNARYYPRSITECSDLDDRRFAGRDLPHRAGHPWHHGLRWRRHHAVRRHLRFAKRKDNDLNSRRHIRRGRRMAKPSKTVMAIHKLVARSRSPLRTIRAGTTSSHRSAVATASQFQATAQMPSPVKRTVRPSSKSQSDASRLRNRLKTLRPTRRVSSLESLRTPVATSTKCSRLKKVARSLAKATR